MNRKPQPDADHKTSKGSKEKPSKSTSAAPPTPEQVNEAVDKHRAAVPGKAPKNKGSIG